MYTGSFTASFLSQISIATIKRVIFGSPPDSPFTNAPVQEDRCPYQIPVQFKDEHNDTDFTDLVSSPNKDCIDDISNTVFLQQVKFECVLELNNGPDVLNAVRYITSEPVFDSSSGKSYCRLFPSKDMTAIASLATLNGLRLGLKVKAGDYQDTYSVWSAVLGVSFLPAFSVDMVSVTLSPTEHSVQVTASGLTKVLNSIQVC